MSESSATTGPPSSSSGKSIAFAVLAFFLCLAAVCGLFAETIGPDKSIFGRDTVSHDYGMLLWSWEALCENWRMPLWNPYLFGGIPTLGTFALNPFNLQSLLLPLFSFPLAFTFYYLVTFAIGGMGMALLLRQIGMNFPVSLLFGIVFSLSGHFTTMAHAGHLTKAMAFAWVPWLFVLAERWFDQPTLRRTLAMSIPLAFMITASHLQIAYLAGVFLCIWLVGAACRAGFGSSPAGRTYLIALRFAQLGLACAFAAVLSAGQLLPGLEMAGMSNRSEGVTHEEAARTSYPPIELLEYVVPGWFGSNAPHARKPYEGTWGAPMNERIVSDYFGVLALVLACVAIAFSRDRRRWTWAVIALLGIWIGVGVHGGLWQVLRHVPGFASFRSPAVAMGWTTLGGLVLAAMGLQRILECASGQWRRVVFVIAAVVMVLDVGYHSRLYIEPFDHNDFARYLQSATPPQVMNDPQRPVRILQKGQELTNVFMASGVGSIHGYHPITLERYDQLIRRIGFYDSRIPALFHQNWMLWPQNEVLPEGWRATELTPRGMLLQRANPMPYVWAPPVIQHTETMEESLKLVSAPDFSPENLLVAENMNENIQPAHAAINVVEYNFNRVHLNVQSSQAGAAVFSDLYAPGWNAYISDGVAKSKLDTFTANAAFRGAVIPAGDYMLEWRYEPFAFRLGLFVMLLGWGILFVCMAAMRFRIDKV